MTASWASRAETASGCARRLQQSLRDIPSKAAGCSGWFTMPENITGRDGLIPVTGDLDGLTALVEASAVRGRSAGVVPGGGFSPSLIRLHHDRPLPYSLSCGVTSRRGNHLSLDLADSPFGDRHDSPSTTVVSGSLKAVVSSWEPQHGTTVSERFLRAQKHRAANREIPVGWLTYLSEDIELDSRAMPDEVSIEKVDGGIYLTLPGHPQHPSLDAALAVRRALGYGR
ncbi:hypothetical protein QMK17_23880 [Rhodococcus sp. G-MC3]|uniref:Imm52 family immunity protein n=1 Tax=Rhodococcus sp. G-MC3 TaxID=3046209 RepID=UPI0024B90139|nr:Imm52 family immunity protein [Rhodococcus sp. G-MC3]MDJ0396349.1 hypothetical protein [Rhodococcus sp. G-MC3]